MKLLQYYLIVFFVFNLLFPTYLFPQTDGCGTDSVLSFDVSPSTFFGSKYKPHRSDLNNNDPDNYFPIMVVFVQFDGDTTGSNVSGDDAWPPGQDPNYLSRTISLTRSSITNWWDAYNGYDINDYWHEFSRSKLHIRGEAFSIILPHTEVWYSQNGGQGKVNKDIYDALIDIDIDWEFYDKWKILSQGNFDDVADERVDMMYVVFRSWPCFMFGNCTYWGVANLGVCEGASSNEYTVFDNGTTEVRIRGDETNLLDSMGSGVILWADGKSKNSRQRFLDVVTHEHCHYFYGSGHKSYGKMAEGNSSNWDFSLSPWEMIKLEYIQQQFVNYSNPLYYLYDYMSRGGTAGTKEKFYKFQLMNPEVNFFF